MFKSLVVILLAVALGVEIGYKIGYTPPPNKDEIAELGYRVQIMEKDVIILAQQLTLTAAYDVQEGIELRMAQNDRKMGKLTNFLARAGGPEVEGAMLQINP